MREAAKDCEACHLYERATQTVFGEGPKDAPMMLVGEQPGDYEDVAGKPFVGPAGKIMDRALEEAGIDRSQVYVTNAVKLRAVVPRYARARQSVVVQVYATRSCHGSPVISTSQPDEESRQREYKRFVSDLRAALKAAGEP